MKESSVINFGLWSIGLSITIWMLIKVISCIFLAGFISNYFGLTGYYWWVSSIISFAILKRVCFKEGTIEKYDELVKKYKNKEDL